MQRGYAAKNFFRLEPGTRQQLACSCMLYKTNTIHSRTVYFIFLVLTLAACKNHDYAIIGKEEAEGKTNNTYIEALLSCGANSNDTLLYYQFNLLNDSFLFRKNPGLNIGIYYSNISGGSSHLINLAFNKIPADQKSNILKTERSGAKTIFTNIKDRNANKGFETAFNFTNDQYSNPQISAYLANEEKMKAFLNLFKAEIQEIVKGSDTVKYISTCHVAGYYHSLVITATLK